MPQFAVIVLRRLGRGVIIVFVVRIQVPPTPRPYKDQHEYCLFFTEGTCKECISRCPVGAITEKGKDKSICYRHLSQTTKDYVTPKYGFDGYGCGLCQTGVPCESKIPLKQDVEIDFRLDYVIDENERLI